MPYSDYTRPKSRTCGRIRANNDDRDRAGFGWHRPELADVGPYLPDMWSEADRGRLIPKCCPMPVLHRRPRRAQISPKCRLRRALAPRVGSTRFLPEGALWVRIGRRARVELKIRCEFCRHDVEDAVFLGRRAFVARACLPQLGQYCCRSSLSRTRRPTPPRCGDKATVCVLRK